MPFGNVRASAPFGPWTLTVFPSTVTVTPAGMATGSLPIRDIVPPLPDEGDELATGARLPRLAVCHQAFRRAEDRDAEPVPHARNLGRADVAAKTGRRHALQLANARLADGLPE